MEGKPELSIIIPVVERFDNVSELYNLYKQGVEELGKSYEFIYVLDGNFKEAFETLEHINSRGEDIKIIKLARGFGEATALTIGFEHSTGEIIVTLPAYQQVEAKEISRVVAGLDQCDMVIARRWPRKDSFLNRIQSNVFHFILKPFSEIKFHDIGCGVRAFKRKVLDDVRIYGEQHRFLPFFAIRYGFTVVEIDVTQSKKDTFQRVYPIRTYIQRFLDILSIFFLLEFTKKPLRFFGILGATIFSIGSILCLYLAYVKLFLGQALGDRPLLLLGILLIVVGIQIFAIGLIGEIIIFVHAKDIKEYTIEEIVN